MSSNWKAEFIVSSSIAFVLVASVAVSASAYQAWGVLDAITRGVAVATAAWGVVTIGTMVWLVVEDEAGGSQ